MALTVPDPSGKSRAAAVTEGALAQFHGGCLMWGRHVAVKTGREGEIHSAMAPGQQRIRAGECPKQRWRGEHQPKRAVEERRREILNHADDKQKAHGCDCLPLRLLDFPTLRCKPQSPKLIDSAAALHPTKIFRHDLAV